MSSRQNSFNKSVMDLFSLAASPLEDAIEPTTHITDFRVTAELEMLPGRFDDMPAKHLPLLRQGAHWHGRVAFLPQLGTLGLSRIIIPQENQYRFQLERSPLDPAILLGFNVPNDIKKPAMVIPDTSGVPLVFRERHICSIIDTLINPLPIFNATDSSKEQQEKLAILKARADAWHSVDAKTIPTGPNTQLRIEKHTIQAASPPDDAIGKESLSNRSSMHINIVRERIMDDGNRNQVVITFAVNDYFVNPPYIHGRIIEPCPDSPNGYKVTEPFEPQGSPALLIEDLTRTIFSDLS